DRRLRQRRSRVPDRLARNGRPVVLALSRSGGHDGNRRRKARAIPQRSRRDPYAPRRLAQLAAVKQGGDVPTRHESGDGIVWITRQRRENRFGRLPWSVVESRVIFTRSDED